MGATFPRVKNWTTEILSNTDLNAEIDNILNNLGPAGVDDYSTNAAQMKLQTSPGTLGSESLATSLAGELERLRYVIQRIIGSQTSYWYESPPTSLSDIVASQGTGLPANRISSGLTTGNSSQLIALRPSGTTASLTLSASVTPFVYYIGGSPYSITANITLSGLSLASGTNNTCSVNYTAAAGQQWTKTLGMYNSDLPVDGMQSGIVALVGQLAGFKAGNEYFLAYVNSTSALTQACRGFFFNSTPTHVPAVGLTDNDEIKLMKLAWIFANTNSSLAVTYTNPTISAEQPSSPTTGDYWFDLTTTAWKTYNSTTWVAANATLIGISMQDTAACVAARTFDSYKAMSDLNTIGLIRVSNTVVQASGLFGEVSIFGSTNRFHVTRPAWDITSDLESGVVEAASTIYYCYMKESGATLLSDKPPIYRRDLGGLYHPGETWRCLGSVQNDSSTHFQTPVKSFKDVSNQLALLSSPLAADAAHAGGTIPLTVPQIFPDHFTQAYTSTPVGLSSGIATASDVQTLSLTPGAWSLHAGLSIGGNGATAWAASAMISTIAGNQNATAPYLIVADSIPGLNHLQTVVPSGVSVIPSQLVLPPVFVNVTETQNYYLKVAYNPGSNGATVHFSSFRAQRLDSLIGMPL